MKIPELRGAASEIWTAALEAVQTNVCIPKALRRTSTGFEVGDQMITLSGRLIVVGAGKAAAGMAKVVERLLKGRISAGLVITKYGHRLPTDYVQVIEAGHPVPDRSGEVAVARMRDILRNLTAEDVVLCLLSGGASALMPSPADGITLGEKQQVTSDLLRAGATIHELNTVRKHLSAIKGGQLLRWAAPAKVVSLIMSDVIGDPLDVIASGPTSPDTTTFEAALGIVRKYGIAVPIAAQERLERGVRGEIPETPKRGDPIFEHASNHVIANNRLLLEAAARRAGGLGFKTVVLSSEIDGEARTVGRWFASITREIGSSGQPVSPPGCVLAGGETTVTVKGGGRGGRNQEMALAWALDMQSWKKPACFASVATDGTDGPTPAAGGLVDPYTCLRASRMNLEPMKFLRDNDSFTLLKSVGDLITTGPTQTNLMDLQIILVG